MLLRSKEKVHFTIGRSARKELQSGEGTATGVAKPGRIPRVSKLMALAIRLLYQFSNFQNMPGSKSLQNQEIGKQID